MHSKARILVIDDDPSLVLIVERVLQTKGFEVLTAFNGLEGLQKAREEKPDLIILDIIMPRMDGYEVCRRLQNDPATAAIPVLMLTVKGRTGGRIADARRFDTRVQDRARGFDVGATEFLSKPITAKELVKRVKALLWVSGFEERQRERQT